MSVTVGMIGLAHPHSLMHLRTLDALEMVDRVAMCDRDPVVRERAARSCAKAESAYANEDELLGRSDIPVVYVTLPTDATPGAVIRAASAGKHVVCEKPGARTVAEMAPVIAALDRRRIHLLVCYPWRLNPAMLEMRELIRAGALGRLVSIEMRMVTTRVGLRDPEHWLFRREVAGGGILTWLGCHWIDLLLYLTGQEVRTVTALTGTVGGEPIDVEDVASVSFRLSGGALASLHAGYSLAMGRAGYEGAAFDQSIVLRGTEGAVRWLPGDPQIVEVESAAHAWQSAPRQIRHYLLPPSPAYGGAHGLRFVETFLRAALEGEGANPASAHDALRVIRLLDAIYLSAAQERVVHL